MASGKFKHFYEALYVASSLGVENGGGDYKHVADSSFVVASTGIKPQANK